MKLRSHTKTTWAEKVVTSLAAAVVLAGFAVGGLAKTPIKVPGVSYSADLVRLRSVRMAHVVRKGIRFVRPRNTAGSTSAESAAQPAWNVEGAAKSIAVKLPAFRRRQVSGLPRSGNWPRL
jgi:hypothetical protein